MRLAERIEARDARLVVLGLGRVGLPLAVAFAAAGHRVAGVDADSWRADAVALGKVPFHDPATEAALARVSPTGRLSVHVDAGEVVPGADVIVLCVGTPMSPDLRADFDQLRKALDELMPHLRSGQLLIQRSTVSPGTLKKVVAPFLRSRAPEVADDLLLAACPERIAEGRAMTELYSLPELIGGIDEPSTTAATALFQTLSADKPVRRTDATSAELAKLFTNVYRYVNFALANEFALLCEYHGTDVHEIIDMANRDYPRAAIPPPGPTGGPCLSKDGYFLVEELTLPDFVLVAWKLNDSTPTHIVRRLDAELRRRSSALAGTPVAVLGRAFKRDSDDLRQSPAGRIIEILEREGAQVRAHDPHLAGPSLEQVLAGARALVLATNHSAYDALDPRETAQWMDEPRVAIDCWGVLDRTRFGAAGIDVTTFGVGEPK